MELLEKRLYYIELLRLYGELLSDTQKAILEDYLEWQKLHDMDGTGIDGATKNLIEIAKKYQKIEHIVKLEKIGEVVEDGQNTIKD